MHVEGTARLVRTCATLAVLLGGSGIESRERVTVHQLGAESSVTRGCFEPGDGPILLLLEGPFQHFDNGFGGGGFPRIDAWISVNGQFCQDTVTDVVAAPVGPRPYREANASSRCDEDGRRT